MFKKQIAHLAKMEILTRKRVFWSRKKGMENVRETSEPAKVIIAFSPGSFFLRWPASVQVKRYDDGVKNGVHQSGIGTGGLYLHRYLHMCDREVVSQPIDDILHLGRRSVSFELEWRGKMEEDEPLGRWL